MRPQEHGHYMDPRGMVCRFHKEYHFTLLYTEYKSQDSWLLRRRLVCVFPIVSICELITQEWGHFLPQGHGWQDLKGTISNRFIHKTLKLCTLWFHRRFFLPIVNLWGANDPWGIVNLDTRGMIDMLYHENSNKPEHLLASFLFTVR